ncbi:MAG: hypothetical protein M5U34_33800 [Chloroflexi bacterium]|nr:hypothetical protein [Chloroflexota bacterium]
MAAFDAVVSAEKAAIAAMKGTITAEKALSPSLGAGQGCGFWRISSRSELDMVLGWMFIGIPSWTEVSKGVLKMEWFLPSNLNHQRVPFSRESNAVAVTDSGGEQLTNFTKELHG